MTSPDPRFICDDHCGRLARWLRFIGYDCAHDQNMTDAELLLKAASEDRIVLTRDHHLAGLVLARRVLLLQSSDPLLQLHEVMHAHGLAIAQGKLLTRCTICNQSIESVESATVWDRIPTYVQQTKTAFKMCMSCRRVYWEGTHVERMLERLRHLGVMA